MSRYEMKKICRVCGRMVSLLHEGAGSRGRRCASCLHRTHREHLAGSGRVCLRCRDEDLSMPLERSPVPDRITLVHLSDIHFGGGGSERLADLLKRWICGRGFDYVLVSGDLTSRAGEEEYRLAARWIRDMESTGVRVAVVPGNHDIGYWGNIMSLGGQAVGRKYHRWIKIMDRPIDPCVRGPGCVVVGLNSAHGINPSRLFKGYLNRRQMDRAVEIFRGTPSGHLKIMFCHHPLLRFENDIHRVVFRAGEVKDELSAAGVRLFLWGHQHSSAVAVWTGEGEKCFAVQSPTLSDRVRGGDKPGFSVAEWFFKEKVLIRTFDIINAQSVEEGKRFEYSLQEGTMAGTVE